MDLPHRRKHGVGEHRVLPWRERDTMGLWLASWTPGGRKVVKEIAEFICFLTWGRGGGQLDFPALPSTWHSWGWASGLHYLREIAVHTAGR